MGLLSPGGVHSHEDHLIAMIDLAARQGAEHIYLHAFLDGRDTPPRSAQASLQRVQDHFARVGKGQIATIVGRYYAMDRDKRWDRVEKAYDLLTSGVAEFTASDAVSALHAAYERGENDEFVKATAITTANGDVAHLQDGDALIFMNFRADRARQFSRCFTQADFADFARKRVVNLAAFVQLTEYAGDINAAVAYAPESLNNVLGEWLR